MCILTYHINFFNLIEGCWGLKKLSKTYFFGKNIFFSYTNRTYSLDGKVAKKYHNLEHPNADPLSILF